MRGGVHALAVDPRDAAVYVVFGDYDAENNRDRLGLVRVTITGDQAIISDPVFLSPPHLEAALPAVAVSEDGSVGILYDTADGLEDDTHIPLFSAHFAVSRNQGKTFQDIVILKFRSPIPAPGFDRELRILGDYQQLKAVGDTFYGVFSANGHDLPRGFNRKTNAIDPIFFKTAVRR